MRRNLHAGVHVAALFTTPKMWKQPLSIIRNREAKCGVSFRLKGKDYKTYYTMCGLENNMVDRTWQSEGQILYNSSYVSG